MTARILDGKLLAAQVLEDVGGRATTLRAGDIQPKLAFVTVGQSEPALMYVRRLQRLGSRHGVDVAQVELPPDADREDLDRRLAELNADHQVDGIIVQMPLPDHLKSADLSMAIEPRKDVDGITVQNAGRLYLRLPGHVPSTAVAMMEILEDAGLSPAGKNAVVVGRSAVVGHPLAELLLQRDATVTVTHRRTRDLAAVTRQAEVLMVAAGRARLVTKDMIRPGVVIVDAGINVVDGGLVGDVAFEECLPVAAAITPVPGGVGPVTNAVLLRSVVSAAEGRVE